MAKTNIQEFFRQYQVFFQKALKGGVAIAQGARFYATAIVGAGPAGVIAAQNDAKFHQFLQRSFIAYRELKTKAMQLRRINITPIDDLHCLAQVGWTAVYDRGNDPDIAIEFDVHYLVQQLQEMPQIFGWVTGDEKAVLQANGII